MALLTIQKRSDFLAANARAQKFVTGSFILQMRRRPDNHPVKTDAARFGFTVTKKMGNAVVRNRIKRRLREAVRLFATPYTRPGHDYILISRLKTLDMPFNELKRDIEFAFSRIHSMKTAGS